MNNNYYIVNIYSKYCLHNSTVVNAVACKGIARNSAR